MGLAVKYIRILTRLVHVDKKANNPFENMLWRHYKQDATAAIDAINYAHVFQNDARIPFERSEKRPRARDIMPEHP